MEVVNDDEVIDVDKVNRLVESKNVNSCSYRSLEREGVRKLGDHQRVG